MYAVSDKHGIYHLLEAENQTRCGLPIVPAVLPKRADAPMHLVKDAPTGYRLCKHCREQQAAFEDMKKIS